ncbi:transcription termination/antitermination factor NusG [bacterium]|jgi:transcription termination/antitermination protein NusG|nr:transcription termination/antitermination factor NusG [bacterium]
MKQWYVVQVYAGYEDVVKADLEKCIKDEGLEELFGQVLIPSTRVKSAFGTDEEDKDQQLFPGYILVEMANEPKAIRLVSSVPKTLKFLGGKDPIPLSRGEIDRVIGQVTGKIEVTTQKSEFVEGKEVEIAEGPFAGFVGVIDKIDEEGEKLTIMVSIFGRMTPVEIGFDQIKR